MKRLILDYKRRIYGKIVVPRWQSTVLMKRTCIWTVIDAFSGRTVHHNVLGSHAYGNSNTTQKALFVAVFMSIELAASIAEDERINLLERKLTNSKRLSNGLCIFQSQKEIVKYVVRNRYYSSSSFIILFFFLLSLFPEFSFLTMFKDFSCKVPKLIETSIVTGGTFTVWIKMIYVVHILGSGNSLVCHRHKQVVLHGRKNYYVKFVVQKLKVFFVTVYLWSAHQKFIFVTKKCVTSVASLGSIMRIAMQLQFLEFTAIFLRTLGSSQNFSATERSEITVFSFLKNFLR